MHIYIFFTTKLLMSYWLIYFSLNLFNDQYFLDILYAHFLPPLPGLAEQYGKSHTSTLYVIGGLTSIDGEMIRVYVFGADIEQRK